MAGRIGGYSLVPGGLLSRLAVGTIAVTADGSRLAFSVSPAKGVAGERPDSIVVLNTRTGARRVWQGSSGKPGTIRYSVMSLSMAASGREAVFLTQPRCVPAPGGPKCHVRGGEEVRALDLSSRGGQVSDSRLLVRQASLMRIAIGYINAAVVSPDGSLVTLAEVDWPAGYISIVQVSSVTGKQVGVVYRLRTGDGFSYANFGADPSARYFILAAGRSRGPIKNGWIDHGRLIRLWPRDGSDVAWEVW